MRIWIMVLDIAKLCGPNLSGRVLGKKHFGQASEVLSPVRPGELIVLDFSKVEYVSASWINAMLVPLCKRAAEEANDLYVVLAVFPANSVDDLQLVAEQSHLPFLVSASVKVPISKATLIGSLDPGQRATLDAAQELGAATGAELAAKRASEGTKATAWNNRLRDLFDKRLLRRRKQGREQIYTPVAKEIIYG
jgi:hypothetical protein